MLICSFSTNPGFTCRSCVDCWVLFADGPLEPENHWVIMDFLVFQKSIYFSLTTEVSKAAT